MGRFIAHHSPVGLNDIAHEIEAPAGAHFLLDIGAPVTFFKDVGYVLRGNMGSGGKDGIKFNVFTTGPHISPEDVPRIFEEGYRGSNIEKEVGTGRGLYFVRNVIETHGGMVGYEPTHEGNNFYFVLPLVTGPEPPLAVKLAASA